MTGYVAAHIYDDSVSNLVVRLIVSEISVLRSRFVIIPFPIAVLLFST